eukprot:COSAG02_NODE_2003_length_10135_cov_9.873754_13_plen_77_part_00
MGNTKGIQGGRRRASRRRKRWGRRRRRFAGGEGKRYIATHISRGGRRFFARCIAYQSGRKALCGRLPNAQQAWREP